MHRSKPGITGKSAVAAVALAALAAFAVRAQPATSGRFVPLGMSAVAEAWKLAHPSDEHFIYSMDSASGRIKICGDAGGGCRSIAESERNPAGAAAGRFVGLGIIDVTKEWKSKYPLDAHLLYSMDTATGQIQICGDMADICTSLSDSAGITVEQSPKVVIVYRRADSAGLAGRVYDRLIAHYGDGSAFLDIYSIPWAANWTERVKQASVRGQILLALIGRNWLGRTSDGRVRINDEADPVRLEIETALQAHVPVFPVLLDGASMPKATELPDGLKSLSSINAISVDAGRDFDVDMARLLQLLDQRLASPTAVSP